MNIIDPHPFEHAPDEQPDPSASKAAFEPIVLAARADGWTPERQRRFIEELADCGIVREAAARVGMSEQSAYRLRRRPDAKGFNDAWEAALQLGAHRLHSTAFERAVTGTVRQRYFAGKVVGEETVFDNRLLIYLLSRLDRRRYKEGYGVVLDWHGALDSIEAGLPTSTDPPNRSHRSPVWQAQNGTWCTRFMPPDNFQGQQWGAFGDKDYYRTLSDEELKTMQAYRARVEHKARHQRDVYFAKLAGEAVSAADS